MNLRKYVDLYCKEEKIEINISAEMPEGYENAFGTYDVLMNTLFINEKIIAALPEYEQLFYLFHELRHASQYLAPEKFSSEIQKSRFYVILYNGICFRLFENEWKECSIEGTGEYFRNLYMNLPYEKDANVFAYRKTSEILGDSAGLRELYSYWVPGCSFGIDEFIEVFGIIDEKCKKGT